MDWWLCGDSCVVDVVVGSGYAVKVVGFMACVMEVFGVGDGLMASNGGSGWW